MAFWLRFLGSCKIRHEVHLEDFTTLASDQSTTFPKVRYHFLKHRNQIVHLAQPLVRHFFGKFFVQ